MEQENNQNNESQESKSERKKGRVQYNLNYPVPEVRSSLERDIKVIKSFVTASDYGQKHVGAKQVAPFIGCNPQIVGGILAFFSKIGFVDKEGYDYKPTQEIVGLVNDMKFETDEKEAGKFLKPLIEKTWFGEMTIKIFQTDNAPLSKDELFKRLGKMCGADPEYHKSAINRIIEYLEFSHLIEYDQDMKKYTLKNHGKMSDVMKEVKFTTSDETSQERKHEPQIQKQNKQMIEERGEIFVKPKNSILTPTLNFNIDNSTDPEKLEKLIRSIRKGLSDEK